MALRSCALVTQPERMRMRRVERAHVALRVHPAARVEVVVDHVVGSVGHDQADDGDRGVEVVHGHAADRIRDADREQHADHPRPERHREDRGARDDQPLADRVHAAAAWRVGGLERLLPATQALAEGHRRQRLEHAGPCLVGSEVVVAIVGLHAVRSEALGASENVRLNSSTSETVLDRLTHSPSTRPPCRTTPRARTIVGWATAGRWYDFGATAKADSLRPANRRTSQARPVHHPRATSESRDGAGGMICPRPSKERP